MRKIILKGQTQTAIIRNCGIDGFNVDARLIADAVNTQPTGVYANNIRVKAILKQGGVEAEIINGNLRQLVEHTAVKKANALGRKLFAQMAAATTGLVTGNVVVTETAGIAGEQFVPFEIYTGAIVLKGNDSLEVTIEAPTDCFHTNCDAASYFTVTENRAIVNQLFIPVIKQVPIPANESLLSRDLGDNVTDLTIHSLDKAYGDFQKVFSTVKFNSDRIALDLSFFEANKKSVEMLADFNFGTGIYSLLNGVEHDQAKIQLDLVSGDITSGQQWMVYSGFYVNGSVLQTGLNRKNRHARRNAAKLS